MNKVMIRKAQLGDEEKIYKLEQKVWGDNCATLPMIKSRLETFIDGAYVAEDEGKIIGVVFFQVIDSEKKYKNWYEYTDNGLIKKTHTLKGDRIFGIDLSVLDKYSGQGIGSKLLMQVAKYSITNGLKGGMLGGRLPMFYKYKDISAEDYVRLRDSRGRIADPELRFYLRAGLSVDKVLPNYFHDPESRDYGVILSWSNPFSGVKSRILCQILSVVFTALFSIRLKLI